MDTRLNWNKQGRKIKGSGGERNCSRDMSVLNAVQLKILCIPLINLKLLFNLIILSLLFNMSVNMSKNCFRGGTEQHKNHSK